MFWGLVKKRKNDVFNLSLRFRRHIMIFRDPILRMLEIMVPKDQRQSFFFNHGLLIVKPDIMGSS